MIIRATKIIEGKTIAFEFETESLKGLSRQIIRAAFDANLRIAKSRSTAVLWTAELLGYSDRWIWEAIKEDPSEN